MSPIGSKQDLTDDQKSKLETVLAAQARAEKMHKQEQARWNRLYGLYRNYSGVKNRLRGTRAENDRDIVTREFSREFGEELFYPAAFTTVETVVPRVLSNDPRMLVEPMEPEYAEKAKPVKAVFERDQKAMKYELHLQDALRSAAIYGLGWQKTYWDRKYRVKKRYADRAFEPGEQVITETKKVYEGPGVDSPDLFDMFWDPNGKSVETCGYIIHRTWRSDEYVAAQVKDRKWFDLDLERVKGMKSDTGRDELWSDRMAAQGITSSQLGRGGLHEVLEYHDGNRVMTVLDRALLVQDGSNPFFHCDMPFQIARPVRAHSEFVGIGLIEPLVQLIYELSSLRGNRLDAAILALNRGYFVQEGMIRPEDFVTGPGTVVPVAFDPRDVIMPMPFQEPPGTSYQEEAALKDDITLTSGVSEVLTGTQQPSGSTTATGIQLVQSAAGERIKLIAKNLMAEMVTPAAAQMRELYSQYAPKEASVRIRDLTTPTGYSWIKVTRDDFANVEVTPEAGSTEAENPAEKRANAVSLTQALAPFMDRIREEKVIKYVLEESGVPAPESWLKSEEEVQKAQQQGQQEDSPVDQLPGMIAQGLVENGLPEDKVGGLIQEAQGKAADPSEFLQLVSQGLTEAGMDKTEADELLVELSQKALPAQKGPQVNA